MTAMGPAEWEACASPVRMLAWLRQQRVLRFKAGRRKVRLLACAWARQVAAWLDERWVREVIEACERHADAPDDVGVLPAARAMAGEALEAARELAYGRRPSGKAAEVYHRVYVTSRALHELTRGQAYRAGLEVRYFLRSRATEPDDVREAFGNPFRPPSFDPAWRAWGGGTVPRLAQGIYDEGRFGDLPVLADALEDAGCADARLLSHLRRPGGHFRGCWALDLVLGKDVTALLRHGGVEGAAADG